MAWKDANVIFIHKPGKDDYSHAKSFRPISLSNYLLKVLEKLSIWRSDIILKDNPIHKLQHGFQRGKSTDTALSGTVNEIEKYILKGHHCVGLFLDIIDTIDPIYIKQRLTEHNIEPDIVNWYYNYLIHQNLISNITGHPNKCTISTGFPQGGGSSAKFWIIAFNHKSNLQDSTPLITTGLKPEPQIIKTLGQAPKANIEYSVN